MPNNNREARILMAAVCVVLASCAGGQTAQPTSAPVPTPRITPTAPPTEVPPTAAPTAAATAAPQPTPTAETSYTQNFSVTAAGDLFGSADDVRDGNSATWASIRTSFGVWTFDLGSDFLIAGLAFWPVKDSSDPVFVRSVEVSKDGATWAAVFTGSGQCGVPDCDEFPEGQWAVVSFEPTAGRYLRIAAGPRFLALAEVRIGTRPLPAP